MMPRTGLFALTLVAVGPAARAQDAPPVVPNVAPPPVVPNAVPAPIVPNPAPIPVVAPAATEPAPAPARRPRDSRDWPGKVFLSGVALFGLSYGLTILAAALLPASDDGASLLYVPVAGPLLYLGQADDGSAAKECILSTLFQAAGIGTALIGFFEMIGEPADSRD